jgi:nicotinamidase-related amidase
MMDCLIVVDLQNDYFAGGKMELVGTEKAAQNARLLLDRCRQSEPTVIHVQHLSMGPGATFFLPERTLVCGRMVCFFDRRELPFEP